ncbi:uncharacterized protein LAJ45_00608 [Morchella importuna]|uniref:uncharacterized protein n=1 Tax=Morchella importuna TaxID=1174673 RepID=UPI001E8CBFD7|nr:uncharacterized protein LAJ45_00608 [Morchella importuna]KAH8155598.1 hypothetical protein LAJ45_00608 [Morchella importuna]
MVRSFETTIMAGSEQSAIIKSCTTSNPDFGEFRYGTPHREIDQHCSGPTMVVYQGEQSISPFKLAQPLELINHETPYP